jgi:hypothetical protein
MPMLMLMMLQFFRWQLQVLLLLLVALAGCFFCKHLHELICYQGDEVTSSGQEGGDREAPNEGQLTQ